MKFVITEGNYSKMGVSFTTEGTIFTFEGKKEAICVLLLLHIHTGEITRLQIPDKYCIGSLRSIQVKGLDTKKFYYNFEIDGQICVDPYAECIRGREHWKDMKRSKDHYQIWGGFNQQEYDWMDDLKPEISRIDMLMYKLHVRGFTMDGGATRKNRGTFVGLEEKLDYLKELGVTTIELMPIYEFEEIVLPPDRDELPGYISWKKNQSMDDEAVLIDCKQEEEPLKVNYWGYIPGNYFAPKQSYSCSADAVSELKDLIRTMHQMSMECVMEIYFDRHMNQNMMIDVLRYWVTRYHVDGFHLVGCGLPIRAMAQDIVLSRTKLFYTEFDDDLKENRVEYPHLYLYSDEYLYPLRKLLNHMDGNIGEFANQQKKQHEVCGYVNYAAINNGYTLADVFSYSEKHNLGNGENNADGLDFNFTANYGVEGPTRKKYIVSIRERQIKNAFAMLMLAQGVPLLASGDEFENSQNGNNNPYCQDNPIGWVNWKKSKSHKNMTDYVKNLINFRKEHPVLRQPNPMQFRDYISAGFPDLSYHADSAWVVGYVPGNQYTGMMYCGEYQKKTNGDFDNDIYIAYNFQSETKKLALPKLKDNKQWNLVMDTSLEEPFMIQQENIVQEEYTSAKAMSIQILIGK